MKMNNILMLFGGMLAATTLFTSCSEEKIYDVDGINYERVYMQNPNTTKSGNILKTPVGYISGFSGKVAVQTTAPMGTATNVTVAIDKSLVDSYNSTNKTTYEVIPEGVVSLEKSNLTVAPGKVVSDTVNLAVSEAGYSKLKADVSYLIPITIQQSAGSNAHLAQDAKFRSNFFVLKYMETNSLIRMGGSASDMIGTPSTDDAGQTWKCIAAEDLDPSTFANLFTGDQWGRKWNLLNGKEVLNASFTVDMGASHKIGGFSVSCSLVKSMDIQLSSDNNKWTDIGDTKNAAAILDSNWNSWYVFYASMSGRYVKINMTLDPDNWAWPYAQWGYCSVNAFRLLLDD